MAESQDNHPFEVTNVNQVKRVPKRGHYDRKTVFEIIDRAWIGHVGILNFHNEGVAVIPMLHARMGDSLIFHGANSSRLMKYLSSGQSVSVSFAMVDGLVLAKSLFHHSMNYRSAVVFGTGKLLTDRSDVLAALKAISDKVMPGRWDDARQPNEKEMSATAVVALQIESASAKIRTGDPSDDEADLDFPAWTGIVPIVSTIGESITDPKSADIQHPGYIDEFRNEFNAGC
ncbi:MAG: pyridoxamine 5'-phosphate oxidase family protein [Mariniblastus sp.]